MKEKRSNTSRSNTKRHTRRVRLWIVLVVLILVGAAAWVLYDGGIIGAKNAPVATTPAAAVATETPTSAPDDTVVPDVASVESEDTDLAVRPACAVIEDTLLKNIVSDDEVNWYSQQKSAEIYAILAQRGCPENAQLFQDLAARKQVIADGLRMAYGESGNGAMTSIEYLYSDEKICETIENRVMKNINTAAYYYNDFLNNAKTYAVLFEYGCRDHRGVYMRAALRELGVAVALMPTDKMGRDEIMTVVEICKSLGVADAAHLMVQRLKARGYDRDFLLEIEDIIHGIR